MIISDKSIAPFFIKGDEHNFTVCEPAPTEKSPDGHKVHGHYGTFEHALLKVCKLKAVSALEGRTITIEEYVSTMRGFLDSIRNLLSLVSVK